MLSFSQLETVCFETWKVSANFFWLRQYAFLNILNCSPNILYHLPFIGILSVISLIEFKLKYGRKLSILFYYQQNTRLTFKAMIFRLFSSCIFNTQFILLQLMSILITEWFCDIKRFDYKYGSNGLFLLNELLSIFLRIKRQ